VYSAFSSQQTPEIQRTPLGQLCLRAKVLGHADVETFFARMIDAPSKEAVREALSSLRAMKILDDNVCWEPFRSLFDSQWLRITSLHWDITLRASRPM
jgi:hypothetical protein